MLGRFLEFILFRVALIAVIAFALYWFVFKNLNIPIVPEWFSFNAPGGNESFFHW